MVIFSWELNRWEDTELITYGRLPLMLMENCIIKNRTGSCGCQNTNILTDRKGARFPVVSAPGCRNELLNSQKLFLADKAADYRRIGLWAQRLLFTTENPRECVQVAQRYLKGRVVSVKAGEQSGRKASGIYAGIDGCVPGRAAAGAFINQPYVQPSETKRSSTTNFS